MSLNEIDPLAESPGAPAPVPAEPKVARSRPAPRDPLYFVVILLLIADIVFGLGLAVFADRVIDFRPMAVVGLGLAGLGLGILAYFVLFGGGKPKK
jgi:F0F1-type ATP synthase assembly protein I